MRNVRGNVARVVREEADDKKVTKSHLLRALNYSDWRSIAARWDGERDYTVPELAAIAEALRTTVPEIWAAAEALEATDAVGAESLGAVS